MPSTQFKIYGNIAQVLPTCNGFHGKNSTRAWAGRAVKVEGLGTWTPAIGLYGKLSIMYWPAPAFSYGLNIPGIFTGTIINRENIGKSGDELVAMWNETYPNDPVELGV